MNAESYPTERFLINNLYALCTYLSSSRNEFDVIVEYYEPGYERTSDFRALFTRGVFVFAGLVYFRFSNLLPLPHLLVFRFIFLYNIVVSVYDIDVFAHNINV